VSADGSRPVTRRSFLETAGKAGLAAGAAAAAPQFVTAAAKAQSRKPHGGMNILVVMVDQMRTPWVYMPDSLRKQILPSVSRLMDAGVCFSNYFTSSNDCTPSRTTQATGLYTHQTAIFATTPPTDLNPGFPTWGTMLRQQGYDTYWFGKWHMSGDQTGGCEPNPYEAWGFTANWPGSGTCPSPNGGPGQGQAMDPVIRQQFRDWLASRARGDRPWAACVSFVNPHDIAWYPRFTKHVEGQSNPPSIYRMRAANFETAAERRARRKPEMQRRSQQIEAEGFGYMPIGRKPTEPWIRMLDTYALMQHQVDIQIGLVLRALRNSDFRTNTIVVFTSDHGEYGGAHGMRGKGFAVYDEGIHVPLIVFDPTFTWTRQPRQPRNQLIESVDLAALLLTLGTGGNDWRGDSRYAQIAGRADIAAMLSNPRAPGRAYIAHATDEPGTSERLPTVQDLRPAPNHITAVRTRNGKFARYAFWKDGSFEIDESRPVQYEAYNYGNRLGRMEIDNIYGKRGASRADRALVRRLEKLLDRAIEEQIQQPVPPALQPVQDQAMRDWFSQPPGHWTVDTDN
jgi:arylsulfatase A-like enzyme